MAAWDRQQATDSGWTSPPASFINKKLHHSLSLSLLYTMFSELSVFQVICYLVGLPIGIFAVLTYKRYARGNHKTLKNCAINVALGPLRYFRIGPYSYGDRMVTDIDISMKYAMKKTKLTDFGGTQFAEAYKRVLNSPEQRREVYSNLGYMSAKIELSMGWVRRLKVVDYMKRHADVAAVPVRSPVFVMGLPRTGTTFLHRLLSLDPAGIREGGEGGLKE